MAPKKPSAAKAATPSAADFKLGDIVLTKVKGYPEWPGKIVEGSSAPENIQRLKAGRPILVRFYPDADYVWAYPKELRHLTHKIIDAYLSDKSKKKQGKLRQGYEIAKDPSEWEAEQARKEEEATKAAEEAEREEEDVDMLDDDAAGDSKTAAGKKRKRTASEKEPKAKKEPAAPKAKKEPAPKKRKTEEKPKATKAAKETKDKSANAAAAATPEEDGSEEEKTVKNWRALLQRAFLTKGVPEAEHMPKYDQTFKEMEGFTMQPQWLASSKLGKVLKKMAALTEEIPREAEFKIKERANALMESWKGMLNKEPSSAPAASGDAAAPAASAAEETNNAGDLTVMQEDEKKEEVTETATEENKEDEAKPEVDAAKEEAAPTTNGVNGGVNAEGQTNGATETEESKTAEEETKKDDPAPTEEKKEAASEEVKENGTDAATVAA